MESTYESFIGDNSSKNIVVQGIGNNVKVIYNGDFDEPTLDWFEHNLKVSISNLGVRYDNELNIKLPLASVFDCIVRNDSFKREIHKYLINIRVKLSDVERIVGIEVENTYKQLKRCIDDLISWHNSLNLEEMSAVKSESVLKLIKYAEQNINELRGAFYQKEENDNKSSSKYENALYYIRQLGYKINDFEEFFNSTQCKLADSPFLLIKGDAGQGKSHLLADCALNHQQKGGASILLLGGEFNKDEFWLQVFRFLGVSSACTKHDFLQKLNSFAESTQKRLLFCIDALNEGQGKDIWRNTLSGIIEDIKKYKFLSLVISVRTNYETLIIPESLKNSIETVKHIGFRNLEYKAIKLFFEHHKLEQPSIPLLNPEFSNPLFLKLFCTGLNNLGLRKVPEGTNGISKVIDLFLNGINEAIFIKFKVSPKFNIAQKCADLVAKFLAEHRINFILFEEAFFLVDSNLRKYFVDRIPDGGIIQLFISEGLLKESRQWNSQKEQYFDTIEFNYERFGDHRQVSYFIENCFSDGNNPFAKNGYLEYLFKEKYFYVTLFEALSIQLPEKLGKELFEFVHPKVKNDDYIFYSLLDSIKWRETSSITNKTYDYLKENRNRDLYTVLNTFISVTNNSKHPFNANFIHSRLINLELAERDAFWSKTIYYSYSHEPDYENGVSSVQRLIDWAWNQDNNENYSDETIYLSAKTITWFFTSPNNTLRDSSTKALICLIVNRLNIAIRLISDFKDVNDPYVLERLLASCYGALTLSKVIYKPLVQKVFDTFFSKKNLPIHLLTRDYARGIIEFSKKRGSEINGNISKIYPPYNSTWNDNLLTENELEERYEIKEINWNNRKDVAQNFVYNLVMNDLSDYKKGTIGSFGTDFSTLHIQDEFRYKKFAKSLNKFNRTLLNNCKQQYYYLEKYQYFKESTNIVERKVYDSIQESVQNNCDLKSFLSESEMQYFNEYIIPYFKNISKPIDKIPTNVIQRFMIHRVFELGWNSELFGEFDYSIENSILNRGQDKSEENFGQKYINIAYYECIARISDNFYFSDYYSGNKATLKILESGLDIHKRNIDPTIIFKSESNGEKNNWWFNYEFNKWDVPYSEWVKSNSDLPDISNIINIPQRDSDNYEWVMLQGFPTWKENVDVPYDELPHRDINSNKEIWYQLRSYIIKKSDGKKFLEWGRTQNFMGRWMIESGKFYGIYNGEYFWSKEYLKACEVKKTDKLNWKVLGDRNNCPVKGLVTVDEYSKSGSEDFSLKGGVSINKPSFSLKEIMNLKTINGFEFTNESDEIICFDPSIRDSGLKCLLIRKDKLLEVLSKKDLTIVWTVLGEKIAIPDYKQYGRLDISGCYYFDENHQVVGFLNFTKSPD